MNQERKIRAARISVFSNAALIAVKLTAGISMHSVSVISEAAHSALDLTAALIAWFSVRESGKPADDKHRYGHGKIENVAGTIEAVLIFGAAVFIIWGAVGKLLGGTVQVEQLEAGLLVMSLSAAANFLVSRHLHKVAKETDSVALEADARHLSTDVYTSLGVVVGLVAIKLTGIHILDPLIAIGVALMIVRAAFELTGKAFFPILDVKLPDAEEAVIHTVLEDFSAQCVGYHKLRTRKSGHVRYIDMHLIVPHGMSVRAAHDLSHKITARIGNKLPHSQVLVHIEPCCDECSSCRLQQCEKR